MSVRLASLYAQGRVSTEPRSEAIDGQSHTPEISAPLARHGARSTRTPVQESKSSAAVLSAPLPLPHLSVYLSWPSWLEAVSGAPCELAH